MRIYRLKRMPSDISIKISMTEGEGLLNSLLRHGVSLPHECEGALVCASCRVIVREGLERLDAASEDEQAVLDELAPSEPASRLACRAISVGGDVLIEIPQDDLERIATPMRRPTLPIGLSELAAKHLAKQLTKRAGSKAVRFAVRPSGCSGLQYVVDYADTIGADDAVFESNGLRMIVDAASLSHIDGTSIDIATEGLGQRLSFNNPNASRTCGCGQSFST